MALECSNPSARPRLNVFQAIPADMSERSPFAREGRDNDVRAFLPVECSTIVKLRSSGGESGLVVSVCLAKAPVSEGRVSGECVRWAFLQPPPKPAAPGINSP